MGRLRREKVRADRMRRTAPHPENSYWLGYRIGLTADRPDSEHTALLEGIGSPDAGRDARGRGYQDGRAFRQRVTQQLYGITEIADALGIKRQTIGVWRDRGKLPEPDQMLAMGPVWYAGTIEPWIVDRRLEKVGITVTTYSDGAGTDYEAIQLPWDQVREIIGRDHDGSPDDDEVLVAALQSKGAPGWVRDAQGWIDEHGWGLIGPEIPEDD